MLFDTTSSETAAQLEARLATAGVKVVVASDVGVSVAYSANGLILRAREEVVNTEYRGLTQAAAEKLLTLYSNSVTTVIYYKRIGTGDEYAAVGVSSGSKSEYSMTRVGDSLAFVVTRVDTTYSAADTSGWSTTRPSSSGTGVVTSKSKRSSRVYTYNGDPLYSFQEDQTTEYRFLSQSEAASKVSSEASDTVMNVTYKHNTTVEGQTIIGASVVVQVGTRKVPTMRYIDADHGFAVTVNQTTYSASGTNWYR